jgi:hypothetical protein
MGYVTTRDGSWYAVSYEGLDPLTGRDRRRWHRAEDESDARARAKSASGIPSTEPPSSCSSTATTSASFLETLDHRVVVPMRVASSR